MFNGHVIVTSRAGACMTGNKLEREGMGRVGKIFLQQKQCKLVVKKLATKAKYQEEVYDEPEVEEEERNEDLIEEETINVICKGF